MGFISKLAQMGVKKLGNEITKLNKEISDAKKEEQEEQSHEWR